MLSYYQERVDSELCTMEEIESAKRLLEENMTVYGTIDEFSKHYNQSHDAVKSVIKRRMIDKPKRNIVMYPFHKFQKLIPDKWRKSH